MSKDSLIILGNQLFPIEHYKKLKITNVFMMEEYSLCTHYKYHKHKILLFLTAMREYKDLLAKNGFNVTYIKLEKKLKYEDEIKKYIKKYNIENLHCFEIEDKFFENRLGILDISYHQSPLFICSRSDFKSYLSTTKRPFMKTFYENIRKKNNILMNGSSPEKGKFSFDAENRKKMPKGLMPPAFYFENESKHLKDISKLINKEFKDHPGVCENFWIPTNRKDSLKVLDHFLDYKIQNFGSYQDSITNRDPFLFHSIISPMLNMGLILPEEIVKITEEKFKKENLPINSVEGFIRQVIGWREFVRGIYQNYSETQDQSNFFNHKRDIPKSWYQAETGFPFLDDAIKKAFKYGYNHHIERLMIMGNMMVLLEINPIKCHEWFMEMYVDSSDWVMGPNVYGMALFSDGGIFATKPYICGANYYLKMSDYKKGEWCEEVNALYWGFIKKHYDYFLKNYRLSMMCRMWDKKSEEDKERLLNLRELVFNRLEI